MGKLGFEPADEAGGVKPQLNAGSLAFKGGGGSPAGEVKIWFRLKKSTTFPDWQS
jgi:hypothetical protein